MLRVLMGKHTYRLIITTVTCLIFFSAEGQFYNGHQMPFGKNRVQYFNYYWSYYRLDDFDCYFNENGRDLAEFTANYAKKKLNEIEEFFDYTLEKRIIFVIYNRSNEYRQSNIGLVTFDEDTYNTGGFNRIIKNKVMLYYEGDHISFQKQIAESITEVLINEILYNAETKDRVASSSVINMPDWYIKGLINYVGFGWDYEAENKVKDGIQSNKYKNITHLEYDDAIYAGQSFWRFIGKKYGDALIPNIIYLTKVYKNIEDGFLYTLGVKLKELMKEWKQFYKEEYAADKNLPGNDGNTLKKSRKYQVYQQVKVSPDSKYLAYVTNIWGRKKIFLYDMKSGKQRTIFRMEPKYEQKVDNTYPVVAWHPGGRILTFINEEKDGMVIYFYLTDKHRLQKKKMLYFDKVLDCSYSPDGSRLVISAVKDGMTDIYIHTIASGANEQITRDIPDDFNPSYIKDDPDQIIFSSNRLTDTLTNTGYPFEKISSRYDLFTYNIAKKNMVLTRLSEGQYASRLQASSPERNKLSFISDNNGILNRYSAVFDSSISFVDTATHYSYFIKSVPVTNYDRNILDQSVANASDEIGEVIFSKGKYNLRKGSGTNSAPIAQNEMYKTNFRKDEDKMFHKADSIEQIRRWILEEDKKRRDTMTRPLYEYYLKNEAIDINHYIFEKEKQNYFEQQWRKKYMNVDLDTGKIKLPIVRIYETSFYNNYIANQIDFSFLNNAYQVFNGGSPYFNPGINMLTRFGILDLLEDYRLTAGFRFSGNFDSNEYLLSIENLKGKFDKQLVFHRQAFFATGDSGNILYKMFTHDVYLTYSKPITPVLALKGTVTYRNDRLVTLSTDVASLEAGTQTRHWASLKGEVIYDNTRKRLVNIYYGTRFKLFGEYYRQLNAKKSDMIVVGGDFRKYIPIHKELIWANRIAASTSFGPTRLLYYLGGVDNWMGYLFNRSNMFDNSIPINPNVNYGFQALATDMRGFRQNIRNGTSFVLINSEVRWPFIRYIAGHPLRSNFLNSLQIVGFGDIGTAWSGKSPWSGENAYDNEVFTNGPVKVTLESNRKPIVKGFGAGLRAQLMGYFIRADWAWGIENSYILPRIFYLSFSLDF
jgi:Tol biopolymer transport system component